MPADKIRRKDLKQQDDFLEGATRFTQWVMQRRRTIGIALLIVIAVVSVIVGVWNYRQRQEENAAARLAAGLQVYEAPVTAADGDPADSAAADEHETASHRHFETAEAKYEAVVESLRPVVEEYGGYPSGQVAAFYLGISLQELGRVDEAVDALQRATDAPAPMVRAMALYRLGQIHVGQDRHEEAIAAFDRLLEESRTFPAAEALTAKARAYEAAGDERAAMVAYQQVADEHPGSVHAAQARDRAEEIAARLGVDLEAES